MLSVGDINENFCYSTWFAHTTLSLPFRTYRRKTIPRFCAVGSIFNRIVIHKNHNIGYIRLGMTDWSTRK